MKLFKKKQTFQKRNIVVRKQPLLKRSVRMKKGKSASSFIDFFKKSRYGIVFFLFLFFYTGFVFFLIFFSSLFQISSLVVEGDENVAREIKEVIYDEIATKEKKVFSKERIFFVDTHDIQILLENNFPHLKEIYVKKIFPHTLQIDFKTETAFLIGCVFSEEFLKNEIILEKENISHQKSDPLVTEKKEKDFVFDEFERINLGLSSEERCFNVDENGFRRGDLRRFSQENRVTLIVMNGQIPHEGDKLFERDQIQLFGDLSKIFKEDLYIDIVETIRIPSLFAQDITVRTQEGWDIRMRTDIALEENIRILRTFFVRVIDSEDRENIRWIDIRIPKKIYYALFNEEQDAIIEDSLEDENQKGER